LTDFANAILAYNRESSSLGREDTAGESIPFYASDIPASNVWAIEE
jgi:hypothetical protein